MKFPVCVLGLGLAVVAGCASRQVQPVMVSASGATGYARVYPERLNTETATLVADKQKSAELSQTLGTRTRELKAGADPELLLVIVQQADEAGRSEAYATAFDEARGLRAFWDE